MKKNVVIPPVVPTPPTMEKVQEVRIIHLGGVYDFENTQGQKYSTILSTGAGTNQADSDWHGCIRE